MEIFADPNKPTDTYYHAISAAHPIRRTGNQVRDLAAAIIDAREAVEDIAIYVGPRHDHDVTVPEAFNLLLDLASKLP